MRPGSQKPTLRLIHGFVVGAMLLMSIAPTAANADSISGQKTGDASPGIFKINSTTTDRSSLTVNLLQSPGAALAISNITDTGTVAKYDKQEITFNVTTTASNPQLPFDAAPPVGVDGAIGVSVDAVFTSPTGKVWRQPGFYYQIFDDQKKAGSEWFYPTGQAVWKVRFSPDEVGTWQYYIKAQDQTGTTQSASRWFTVTASTNQGFIRVSKTDQRYFEYSDGTYFPALGMNSAYNEIQWTNPGDNQDYFQKAGSNGIQVIRMWLSTWSIFGSSWNPWYSIRNDYDGYLPRTGLITNGAGDEPMSYMRLVYADGNSYYFDACRFIGGFQAAPAVKQNTTYHIKIRYKAQGISGPRNPAYPGYGFVAKIQNPNDGNWHTNCYNGGDPQNGVKVTGYGHDSQNWTYLEGQWNSGNGTRLPIFYLALENANNLTATVNGQPWDWHPEVDIDTVFIGEDLGNGQYGPNIVTKPSMEHLSYYMERNAYAFDKALDIAKQNGVYLKLVVMEKNEHIENEIGYDGNAATFDNNNFYGNYRTMTAVRWYQQAWWRYLQARWGYSPNIFAFEAVNEAAPGYTNHYGQVDEMGKYLHCGVFGVSVLPYDGERCDLSQPNAHMVSTSFMYGFESTLFKGNKYPNIDYADIHQYIAQDTDPIHFQDTALSTYDLGLAYGARESGSGKPVIRGETGLIYQDANTDSLADVSSDTQGVWLHNLIWGGINPTGLIESYWYARDHIYKTVDLRGEFKNYYTFIKDIPLNNGKFVDATATVSNSKLRAWGQKDLTNQRGHLWIANTDHVWTNTGTIAPISGTITISGFSANKSYNVEWWNTYTGSLTNTQVISTDSNGKLTLTVSNLVTDVAVKIRRQNNAPTDISLSKNNVNENAVVGTTIGALTTADTDANESFIYTFCGGADDSFFNLEGNFLKTAVVFDFESKSSHQICIRSTDAYNSSITRNFNITVNNVAETDAPVVFSVTRAALNPSNASSVDFTVTFSETVTGVDISDFLLTTTGVIGSAISNVSGLSGTYTVTVDTGSGNGTIRLDVMDDNTIIDMTGNPLGGSNFGDGNFTLGETYTITKDFIFSDVVSSYWAWEYIERLYNAGITGGCSASPLSYCPEIEVTRAQMAVFLEKGIHYPISYTAPDAVPTFSDAIGHWAGDWIEALKNDGITAGCAMGLYCPEDSVTRAQMAVFILKARHGSMYTPPAVGASTGFGDIPTDHWASAWIKQLAAESITGGCGGGNYCPESPVTRAQMAVFLVKAFNLP